MRPATDAGIAPGTAAGPATAAGAVTRAEAMFALIQTLADLGADAESRAHLRVSRLDNDLALVDQVRVMVLDLLRSSAPDALLDRAVTAITTTAASL